MPTATTTKKPAAEKKPAAKKETTAKKTATPKAAAKPKADAKPKAAAKTETKPKAAAKPKAEDKTKADAKKKKQIVSTHPDGGWQVKIEGGSRATKRFDTKAEADKYAKELAKKQDTSIVRKKKDGKIQKQHY